MASPGGKSRRAGRVSRSGDFDRVYKQGRSRGGQTFVAYAFEREDDADGATRLGITVGRKVGSAVKRNSVKRAVREAFGDLDTGLPQGCDIVIVARSGAAELVEREGTDGVKREITDLMVKLAGTGSGA